MQGLQRAQFVVELTVHEQLNVGRRVGGRQREVGSFSSLHRLVSITYEGVGLLQNSGNTNLTGRYSEFQLVVQNNISRKGFLTYHHLF